MGQGVTFYMRQTGSYFTRKSTKATSGFIHEPKANVADSLKLSEMQRTNIEYERQRHLANWLKKSEHHMATTNAQHSVAENAGLHTPTSNVVSIAIAPTNLSTQTIQGKSTPKSNLYIYSTNLPILLIPFLLTTKIMLA